MKQLALGIILGGVLFLPPRGGNSVTLGQPGGPIYQFRSPNGDTTIMQPGSGRAPIYDFDNGGGNHITLEPGSGRPPVFTFGDGDDD
jgi:hypothetical protein